MSTHIHYEARTGRGALIERADHQDQAGRRARLAVADGLGGVHVVRVTTVVTEVEVYRPDAPERTPSSTEARA